MFGLPDGVLWVWELVRKPQVQEVRMMLEHGLLVFAGMVCVTVVSVFGTRETAVSALTLLGILITLLCRS